MVEVKKYTLPPTALIPNSPHPLLHYPGLLSSNTINNTTSDTDAEDTTNLTSQSPEQIHDLFGSNGWQTQWIFRYGSTQRSHYHSATHECMAVLSGEATIRFGVADTSADMSSNTHGNDKEAGGIELQARAGDVFIIPAGVSHKTYDTSPAEEFRLLTPGDGHNVAAPDVRRALADIKLSGFTMIGAYPVGSGYWDFAEGGESEGQYQKVWDVQKPELDPVLGNAEEGICGQWQ